MVQEQVKIEKVLRGDNMNDNMYIYLRRIRKMLNNIDGLDANVTFEGSGRDDIRLNCNMEFEVEEDNFDIANDCLRDIGDMINTLTNGGGKYEQKQRRG